MHLEVSKSAPQESNLSSVPWQDKDLAWIGSSSAPQKFLFKKLEQTPFYPTFPINFPDMYPSYLQATWALFWLKPTLQTLPHYPSLKIYNLPEFDVEGDPSLSIILKDPTGGSYF